MASRTLTRHRRALGVFVFSLLVFLLVFNAFIIHQQRQVIQAEIDSHTRQEFQLLGELISAALTQGNYAVVEQALNDWGQLNDSILQAQLTTANGFLLGEYATPYKNTRTAHYEGKLSYGVDRQARITVLKDMAPSDAVIVQLALWLFGFSALLLTLLGLFMHRFAIKPLQQEIEQHLHTEQRLLQQTRELKAVNDELESFNYSLSHDLRTPLRAITSYSQIIDEGDGERLSPESRQFFQRIVEASKHMAQLIDDILDLARVSRVEMDIQPVDLSAIAQQYLSSHESEGSAGLAWTVQPELVAQGNAKLLEQLLQNLLGNAIKYSTPTPQARVSLATVDRVGATTYVVSDNGVGFNMRFASKVFEPFQRLHDQAEFTGTGIGMATAKRIVERHGGRIWVKSKPGEGTRFFFTLQQDADPPGTATQQNPLPPRIH